MSQWKLIVYSVGFCHVGGLFHYITTFKDIFYLLSKFRKYSVHFIYSVLKKIKDCNVRMLA